MRRKAEDEQFNARVGKLIRQARLDLQLDQTELAARIGTSQSAISEVETGTTGPTIWLLRRIARGLGCELRIVFERRNYETT